MRIAVCVCVAAVALGLVGASPLGKSSDIELIKDLIRQIKDLEGTGNDDAQDQAQGGAGSDGSIGGPDFDDGDEEIPDKDSLPGNGGDRKPKPGSDGNGPSGGAVLPPGGGSKGQGKEGENAGNLPDMEDEDTEDIPDAIGHRPGPKGGPKGGVKGNPDKDNSPESDQSAEDTKDGEEHSPDADKSQNGGNGAKGADSDNQGPPPPPPPSKSDAGPGSQKGPLGGKKEGSAQSVPTKENGPPRNGPPRNDPPPRKDNDGPLAAGKKPGQSGQTTENGPPRNGSPRNGPPPRKDNDGPLAAGKKPGQSGQTTENGPPRNGPPRNGPPPRKDNDGPLAAGKKPGQAGQTTEDGEKSESSREEILEKIKEWAHEVAGKKFAHFKAAAKALQCESSGDKENENEVGREGVKAALSRAKTVLGKIKNHLEEKASTFSQISKDAKKGNTIEAWKKHGKALADLKDMHVKTVNKDLLCALYGVAMGLDRDFERKDFDGTFQCQSSCKANSDDVADLEAVSEDFSCLVKAVEKGASALDNSEDVELDSVKARTQLLRALHELARILENDQFVGCALKKLKEKNTGKNEEKPAAPSGNGGDSGPSAPNNGGDSGPSAPNNGGDSGPSAPSNGEENGPPPPPLPSNGNENQAGKKSDSSDDVKRLLELFEKRKLN